MSLSGIVQKTKDEVLKEAEESIQMFLKDFGPDDIFHDGEFEVSDGTLLWDPHSSMIHVKDLKTLKNEEVNIYKDTWPFHAEQGQIGDCWLIAAIMVVSRRRELLEQMIQENEYTWRHGIFSVRLFFNGTWQVVIVDGFFPTLLNSRQFYFAQMFPTELWINIVEKAVSKLYGGYQNLENKMAMDAFRMFTGAKCDVYQIDPKWSNPEVAWETLTKAHASNFLISFSTRKKFKPEVYLKNGLLHNHAYAVLEVSVVNGHRMVLMGNTSWSRWNGKWSKLPAYSEEVTKNWSEKWKKAMMGRLFWMEMNDVWKWFEMVTICRYREGWKELRIDGGGQKFHRISVSTRCQLTIELIMEDTPWRRDTLYSSFANSPDDVGLICVHRTTAEGKIDDLVVFHPVGVHICNRNRTEETEPIFLEPGRYIIGYVNLSEGFSKSFKWAIKSPTVKYINYDSAMRDEGSLAHFSIEKMILKHGKVMQNVREGLNLWEFSSQDFSILMVGNSTDGLVTISATVSTVFYYKCKQAMSPESLWDIIGNKNLLRKPVYKTNRDIQIPAKSNSVIGTMCVESLYPRFRKKQPITCCCQIEVLNK